MKIEDLEVCPNCFSKIKKEKDVFICKKCDSSFQKGEEIVLSLGKAMKLRTINDVTKRNRGRVPVKRARSPKKDIPHKTGFFGVMRIKKTPRRKNGGWRYVNVYDGLDFQRVHLLDLKKKVISEGGRWKMVYRPSAQKSAEEDGCRLEDLL